MGLQFRFVLGLLSKEVLSLILISSLLAYPIAYFGSKYWLEGFANRVIVSPLIYLFATIIVLFYWLVINKLSDY